jgi:hypothetical protein
MWEWMNAEWVECGMYKALWIEWMWKSWEWMRNEYRMSVESGMRRLSSVECGMNVWIDWEEWVWGLESGIWVKRISVERLCGIIDCMWEADWFSNEFGETKWETERRESVEWLENERRE